MEDSHLMLDGVALQTQDFTAGAECHSPPRGAAELLARARRVAAVAAAHADAVDREGRFPAEAIAALKDEHLLGVLVPASLGGEEARYGTVAEICHMLGQACSATAMIYAMHQIKVACVVRHLGGSEWHAGFLGSLLHDQLLVASSTTEGTTGGQVRSSDAAIGYDTSRITLERDASVISYGAQADALVTTARRSGTSAASDQVLLVLRRSDYRLSQTQTWNTLGMRGTCSTGFALRVDADVAQIIADPYVDIHRETMVPVAHLLWTSVWSGIAASATERARKFTRNAVRKSGGTLPPAAAHLIKANGSLRALRALIVTALDGFEAIAHDRVALASVDFQTRINLLKVDASELAVATVLSAMRTCGLSGYRNDGEASIGRHLRDVLSSPVMINNDRILADLAMPSLITETPSSLRN